ncbi:MAG: ribonuclease H-like domain-containing protein, partial [Phycisphaerae bacterium]|nr:ribonuclease H-like domain-containing protein [Phycisphaerae bacterium]
MIRNRFSVFQGVGPKTEQVIWNAGILTWDQFLSAGQIKGVSARVRQSLTEKITFWQAALDRKDHRFFAENLAGADHWLLFEEFGDSVCYLDIETTGLSANYGDVTTVVGIYNGQKFEVFIRDDNLAGQTLSKALANCKLLITYNGRT